MLAHPVHKTVKLQEMREALFLKPRAHPPSKAQPLPGCGTWEWEAQQPLTLRRCLGATEGPRAGMFGTKGVAALQCELFGLFLHYVADPLVRRRK